MLFKAFALLVIISVNVVIAPREPRPIAFPDIIKRIKVAARFAHLAYNDGVMKKDNT